MLVQTARVFDPMLAASERDSDTCIMVGRVSPTMASAGRVSTLIRPFGIGSVCAQNAQAERAAASAQRVRPYRSRPCDP